MSSIEEVAKSWLVDPAWQKVFKHTLDVVEDYVCYVLVTVGAIALSVRLLTTLSTGDLVCIMIGVENGTGNGTLLPYSVGGTVGMINYAQSEETCIRMVFNHFMEYLPYIMLLETLLLVIVEKFTFKIPRIAQRVERFYKNIVEESLFGKDPDVAEDVTDLKTSTEAISRKRQRKEICVSLKRSSIIHHVYIGKNFVECVLVLVCLAVNVSFAVEPVLKSARCRVPIQSFPGVVDDPGVAHFQCRGKKRSFFMLALWVQVALLAAHLLLSLGAVIWCWRFRAVTNLLRTIETTKRAWGEEAACGGVLDVSLLQQGDGQDFLFLFDLIAHSCGLESTLRVLTHSDDNFYQICKPKFNMKECLQLEEDKLKISWKPADIERWLHSSGTQKKRSIDIDSYEVTIFPSESVKNSQTLPATWDDASFKDGSARNYSTWFYDLAGGRTEYVITIACMIGKSRMKGEKVVTNLVPYGPEKPRAGMQKSAGTDQVEICWDQPKGEFTKYTLYLEKLEGSALQKYQQQEQLVAQYSTHFGGPLMSRDQSFLRLPSVVSEGSLPEADRVRKMENLSHKITAYSILDLDPGQAYAVELGTKTGNVTTRQSISDVVLTRPLPVSSLMSTDVAPDSAALNWAPPEGAHPCLKGVQMSVVTAADGKVFKDMAVPKALKSFKLQDLTPATDYEVSLVSLAWLGGKKRYESDAARISLTTPPNPPRNLRQDHATPNSLVAKWDADLMPAGAASGPGGPGSAAKGSKFKLAIESVDEDLDYGAKAELAGDKQTYNFTRLPDPEGTGRQYNVRLSVSAVVREGKEVSSDEISAVFATIPLKPSNLVPSGRTPTEVSWIRSWSPKVCSYRVTWKKAGEVEGGGSSSAAIAKGGEATVAAAPAAEAGEDVYFDFVDGTLEAEAPYKVNVYAAVEFADGSRVESRELHEKLIFREGKGLAVYVEEQKED